MKEGRLCCTNFPNEEVFPCFENPKRNFDVDKTKWKGTKVERLYCANLSRDVDLSALLFSKGLRFRGISRGVLAKVLDYGLEVSEFKRQLRSHSLKYS